MVMRRLILKNKAGQEMMISNSDDNPNAWYSPWTIDVDQLQFKLAGPEIGAFFLDHFKPEHRKEQNVKLLLQIAEARYHKKKNGREE